MLTRCRFCNHKTWHLRTIIQTSLFTLDSRRKLAHITPALEQGDPANSPWTPNLAPAPKDLTLDPIEMLMAHTTTPAITGRALPGPPTRSFPTYSVHRMHNVSSIHETTCHQSVTLPIPLITIIIQRLLHTPRTLRHLPLFRMLLIQALIPARGRLSMIPRNAMVRIAHR